MLVQWKKVENQWRKWIYFIWWVFVLIKLSNILYNILYIYWIYIAERKKSKKKWKNANKNDWLGQGGWSRGVIGELIRTIIHVIDLKGMYCNQWKVIVAGWLSLQGTASCFVHVYHAYVYLLIWIDVSIQDVSIQDLWIFHEFRMVFNNGILYYQLLLIIYVI